MEFRTLELYAGSPPELERLTPDSRRHLLGHPEVIEALTPAFQQGMADHDSFRSPAIQGGDASPIYASFQRIKQTAGLGIWMRYQTDDPHEIVRRGVDGYTLLLSGVAADADDAAMTLFAENAKPSPELLERVRLEARPIAVNFYVRPNVVLETDITSAAAAMTWAFFSLLGADLR